jgi:hypothetical protein
MSRHKWAYVHKQGGNRAGQRYPTRRHAATRPTDSTPGHGLIPSPRTPRTTRTTTLARTRARDDDETTARRATRPPTRPFKRHANHTTAQPHDQHTRHATHHEPARAVRLRPSLLNSTAVAAGGELGCMGSMGMGMALARHSRTTAWAWAMGGLTHGLMSMRPCFCPLPCGRLNGGQAARIRPPRPGSRAAQEATPGTPSAGPNHARA